MVMYTIHFVFGEMEGQRKLIYNLTFHMNSKSVPNDQLFSWTSTTNTNRSYRGIPFKLSLKTVFIDVKVNVSIMEAL